MHQVVTSPDSQVLLQDKESITSERSHVRRFCFEDQDELTFEDQEWSTFSNSQNDFRVIELSTQTTRLESWTFSSSQHESSRVVDVLELSTQLDSSDGTLNTNRIERLKCLNCQDKLIGDMYVLELTSE